MKIRITPGRMSGSVTAPPSKSYAHRMIICAALAEGKSVIRGVHENEDVLATLDCVSAFGAKWSIDGDVLTVYGVGAGDKVKKQSDDTKENYPCRESGSTLRFFIPVSLVLGENARFVGAKRLMERGIGVYEKLFSERGIYCKNDGKEIVLSGRLTSGEYVLVGDVSSQFISGLMFALPLLRDNSVIKILPPVESRGYIDITLDVLRDFGIEITETEKNTFEVRGGQRYQSRDTEVEADWSNGAALIGLRKLSKVGNVDSCCEKFEVLGLKNDSLQGDRVCVKLFEQLDRDGAVIDISSCPDLGPVLFAVAAAKNGGRFIGTRRLRIKESDRASVSAEELKRFGIDVTVEENSVTVHKGILKAPSSPCQSHNDHRIVMAVSLLGALVGCEIEGAEAITKSYPDFFEALAALGLEVNKENEAK